MKIYCPKCGAEVDTDADPAHIGDERDFAFCPNNDCLEVINLKYDKYTCVDENLSSLPPTLARRPPGNEPKQEPALSVKIEPPPTTTITIEFPFSTSQTFDFAVSEAAKHPSFKQFGEGKKAVYRVTYERSDLIAATELLEYLKGWRRRVVYVGEQKVPWDSVFGFLWCFQRKQGCFKPEYYCFGYENEWEFNIWGCIQARLPFKEGAEWFCWGRFINDQGDWQFNKERICHEIQKNLHPYRFCPALD